MDEDGSRSRPASTVRRVAAAVFTALLVTSAPVMVPSAGPPGPPGDFWCEITPACTPPVD